MAVKKHHKRWPKNYVAKQRVHVRLPVWMHIAVDKMAAKLGIKRTKFIEDALTDAINLHASKSELDEIRGED